MGRLEAPKPGRRDIGGTLAVLATILVCVFGLALYLAPLLLLTPSELPILERIVRTAGYVPGALVFALLVYLGAGWFGAEHPWWPRRYLATALMYVGIFPWLLLVVIHTGIKSLFSDGGAAPSAPAETLEAGPTTGSSGGAPSSRCRPDVAMG